MLVHSKYVDIRKKYNYLNDCYYHTGKFNSNFECFISCIFSWHIETINIWSMIILMLNSTYYMITVYNFKTFLLWIGIITQSCGSISYHSLLAMDNPLFFQKIDTGLIFVLNLLKFSATNYNIIPFNLYLIIKLFLTYKSYKIIKKIVNSNDPVNIVKCNLYIFFLNYICLFYKFKYNIYIISIPWLLYLMYMFKLPERITKTRKYGIAHEYFHYGLIVQNILEHRYIAS